MWYVAELEYAFITHIWVVKSEEEARKLFKQVVRDNEPDADMDVLFDQGYHEEGEYTIQFGKLDETDMVA